MCVCDKGTSTQNTQAHLKKTLKLNSKGKKKSAEKISPAKEADVGPVMYARGMTRARATSAVVAEDPSKTIQRNATPPVIPFSSLRTAAPRAPFTSLLDSSAPLLSSPLPSTSASPPRSCRTPNKSPPDFFSRDNYHKRAPNLSLISPAPSLSPSFLAVVPPPLSLHTHRAYS